MRDLAKEDEAELVAALKKTESTREELKGLSKTLKSLPKGEFREHLQGKIAAWRNKIKSNLNYYLQRLLFPLKGLGVHGCRYNISLEHFTNPDIAPRSFTISGEDSGFGDIFGVRTRLFGSLETISRETKACLSMLQPDRQKQMEHPLRCERVPHLVNSAKTMVELDECMTALATATEEELLQEQHAREAQRKKLELLATVPLKNFVRYKWLLLPTEQSNICQGFDSHGAFSHRPTN